MDKRQADAYVYGALLCATTCLAIVLDYNKRHARRKIEPDWTIGEVAVGSAICLVAGAARARLGDETRHEAERSIWLAFLIGAVPIAIWQEWRRADRRHTRDQTLRHYIAATEETHGTQGTTSQRSPATVAPLRWPGQSPN
jgi:hypothetical protein